MAVDSKPIVTCPDAPRGTVLTAVMRDVREAGFAVIPDFIDTVEIDDLRQACHVFVFFFDQLWQLDIGTYLVGLGKSLYNKMLFRRSQECQSLIEAAEEHEGSGGDGQWIVRRSASKPWLSWGSALLHRRRQNCWHRGGQTDDCNFCVHKQGVHLPD